MCIRDRSRVTAPGFLEEVARKGDRLRSRLEKMPGVRSVRGLGLMLGVELDGISGREAAEKCVSAGLLVLTAKSLMRLLPPLTITDKELDRGLSILEKVLTDCGGKEE